MYIPTAPFGTLSTLGRISRIGKVVRKVLFPIGIRFSITFNVVSFGNLDISLGGDTHYGLSITPIVLRISSISENNRSLPVRRYATFNGIPIPIRS